MTLAFLLSEKRCHWRVSSRGMMGLTLFLLEHVQGERLGGYCKNPHVSDGDRTVWCRGEAEKYQILDIYFLKMFLKCFVLSLYILLNISFHHFLGYSSSQSSHQCLPFTKKHIFCQCISFSKSASRCGSWAWGSQQWGNNSFYPGCLRKHFDVVCCKHVWSIFLCLGIRNKVVCHQPNLLYD